MDHVVAHNLLLGSTAVKYQVVKTDHKMQLYGYLYTN